MRLIFKKIFIKVRAQIRKVESGKIISAKRPLSLILLVTLFILGTLLFTSCTSTPSPQAEPTATRTPPSLGPSSTPTDEPPSETPTPIPPTAEPGSQEPSSDWSRGPEDAEVTITVYSDFQ